MSTSSHVSLPRSFLHVENHDRPYDSESVPHRRSWRVSEQSQRGDHVVAEGDAFDGFGHLDHVQYSCVGPVHVWCPRAAPMVHCDLNYTKIHTVPSPLAIARFPERIKKE